MELSKQVTSLEISKYLKELGVKHTGMFFWKEIIDNHPHAEPFLFQTLSADKLKNKKGHYGKDENDKWEEKVYSAFTVAELGEMLPNQYDKRQEGTWFVSTKNLANEWECGYANSNGFVNGHATGKTEAEARGKILVWLLENNLI